MAGHLHQEWNPVRIVNHFRMRVIAELKDLVVGARELIGSLGRLLSQMELANLFTKEPVLKF